MTRWVECVPNFSEGRNLTMVDQIADAVRTAPNTTLLHVDPGPDANRTVLTFASHLESAVEAGFRAIAVAARLIDMTRHSGVHRRIGATDVFPFVPLHNTTMDECVVLARQLGERVWKELNIPVYLYGEAAAVSDRVGIPRIRRGGYEALSRKIRRPEFKPDFGTPHLPKQQGATIIGARDFLLAYNINLDTVDVAIARKVAREVRESGVAVRDENGRIIRNEQGRSVRRPGLLKGCQADGWFMSSYRMAQVTMNLLNFRLTGLHDAFEAVRGEAGKLGIETRGSEIIGMVPKAALTAAGAHYLGQETAGTTDESKLIDAAIHHLGLSAVAPFFPEQRIIENVVPSIPGFH